MISTDPKVLLVEPSRRSAMNQLLLSGLADRGLDVPYFASLAEMAAAGVGLSNAEAQARSPVPIAEVMELHRQVAEAS